MPTPTNYERSISSDSKKSSREFASSNEASITSKIDATCKKYAEIELHEQNER